MNIHEAPARKFLQCKEKHNKTTHGGKQNYHMDYVDKVEGWPTATPSVITHASG
jgi:hypothetical protein